MESILIGDGIKLGSDVVNERGCLDTPPPPLYRPREGTVSDRENPSCQTVRMALTQVSQTPRLGADVERSIVNWA